MEKYFTSALLNNPFAREALKSFYPQARERNCDCGYDTSIKDESKKHKCPVNLALSNHVAFPSLQLLPVVDGKSKHFLSKNWCFLVELHENIVPDKRWSGFSVFGEEVILNLTPNNNIEPTTFKWSDFKQENTVAILYAKKMKNKQINVDNSDSIYVINSGLIEIFQEAKNLLNDADTIAKGKKSSCFGCGNICEKISRCSRCKLAKYCSIECQRKCWNETHKKLCSQNEIILRLSALPRHEFKTQFNFKLNKDEVSLPSYVYKQEFDYNLANKKETTGLIKQQTCENKCGLCGETNQAVFIKKGKPLTKTECCNNWICDDQHTYKVGSFLRNSCFRNHQRYTNCSNHFQKKHSGKWQDCLVCKNEMHKIEYVFNCTNKFNFPKEKLDIKDRAVLICHNCGYLGDDLENFAGEIVRETGDTCFFCKKAECKRNGGFDSYPDDTYIVLNHDMSTWNLYH